MYRYLPCSRAGVGLHVAGSPVLLQSGHIFCFDKFVFAILENGSMPAMLESLSIAFSPLLSHFTLVIACARWPVSLSAHNLSMDMFFASLIEFDCSEYCVQIAANCPVFLLLLLLLRFHNAI